MNDINSSSSSKSSSSSSRLKEEMVEQKAEMENKEAVIGKDQVEQDEKTEQTPKCLDLGVAMMVVVEARDNRLGGREEVMCEPEDTVSSLVDRYLDKCGGVVGSSGYMASSEGGLLLDMGNTLTIAGIRSGDTIYIACKSLDTEKGLVSRWCPWHLVSLLCGLVCLLTSVGAVTAWCLLPAPPDRYLVLLDAGSVHTSVYTYRYSYSGPAGTVSVTETNFCELGQTGISSFKADPGAAARFISSHSCVLSSIAKVPPISRPLSTLLLGSTAGMRVLKLSIPETAKQILGNLTRELDLVSRGMTAGASILGGEEEGVDGWVTANYLGGGLRDGELIGALDWGGASAQITRVVEEESDSNRNLTLYGREYQLLARTNLCYGQAEALARHRAGLVYSRYREQRELLDGEGDVVVEDACLPQGAVIKPVTLSKLYGSPCTTIIDSSFMDMVRDSNKTITFTSQHNMTICSSLVLDLFTPQTCKSVFSPQPNETTCLDPDTIPPPGNIKYLAFSTYWYLTSGLNLPTSFPLSNFTNITSTLCSANATSSLLTSLGPVADMACFQATFMTHLLTTAYHFNSSTWPQISFVKRVSDAEVGWGLGHAIVQANNVTPSQGGHYISVSLFVVLLCVCCLLLLLSVATAYQGRRVRRQYSRLQETA